VRFLKKKKLIGMEYRFVDRNNSFIKATVKFMSVPFSNAGPDPILFFLWKEDSCTVRNNSAHFHSFNCFSWLDLFFLYLGKVVLLSETGFWASTIQAWTMWGAFRYVPYMFSAISSYLFNISVPYLLRKPDGVTGTRYRTDLMS
jgi:hypothetical protein